MTGGSLTSPPRGGDSPTTGGVEARAPLRGVGRDILITTLAQVGIAVGGLLLYRLLAVKKGAEGVAVYSLIKQNVVFVWPLIMLGMQAAIPRYIALGRGRAGAVEGYLLAAVALTGATTVAVSVLAFASPSDTASLLFGDSGRTKLVFPLVATLVATVALEVVYGYYRGQSNFLMANAVRLVSVAAFPVVLLIVAGDRSIETLISLMAAGVLVSAVLTAFRPLTRAARAVSPARAVAAGRTLIDYGYRRIPGDVASVVLFAVPTVLAAHFVPLHRVAYLSTGLYVMAMISIAFQPIGMVFLPLLARLCATDWGAARRHVSMLATSAIHIAIFVTPQMVLFADVAVRVWLGPEFKDAGTIIAILAAPAGAYVFYVVLRSALDAATVTAYNARNNVIALALAALVATASLTTHAADPLNCIAWSFTLGLLTLGALTLLSVIRVYRLHPREFALPLSLGLGALCAAAAWVVDLTAIGNGTSLSDLLLIAGLELVLGTLYFAGLVRAGVTWPSELRARFSGGRRSGRDPTG